MRVIIVTCTHEFSIDITPLEPVTGIKSRIKTILNIPVESQILSVLGWELIDGLDMEDYPFICDGIKIDLTTTTTLDSNYTSLYPDQEFEEDEVHLIKNNNMMMMTKIPLILKFTSTQFEVSVDRTDTVHSLKEKIHIIEGTPMNRLSLYFTGIEMIDESRRLEEYGIVNEWCEVNVLLKSMSRLRQQGGLCDGGEQVEITCRMLKLVVQTSISLLNGERIPLEVKDLSTVSEVRDLLLSEKVLPEDDYIFIHKQRIMKDGCSLRWHGVESGDYLYVFKGTVSRSNSGRF